MKFIYVLCFLCTLYSIDAFKILIVYPMAIRSITILGEKTVKHLLKAGHEVTFVTAFPQNEHHENFTEIDISSTQTQYADDVFCNTAYTMQHAQETDEFYLQLAGIDAANLTFSDPNFKKFLENTNLKFDVVIADFIESELSAGIAALYECPLIWSFSMGAHPVAVRLLGEGTNPAYYIDHFTHNVVPFTFWERVEQLYSHIRWHYYKRFYTKPTEGGMYKEFYGPYFALRNRSLPAYDDLIHNASVVLSNDHHSVGDLPALPQGFKFVGGFHVDDPPKPLPKDLQSIMDNAEYGVIYFSLGTLWKSKDMPAHVRDGLIKMFGELKQTVIWKYEEDLHNLPPNLHVVKWAPQQSILAHPNVRMFITHSGHLGSTEAFHFGVPLIGLPAFYDQHTNIKKAVKAGYALTAPLDFNMATNLRPLIREMLDNPKYTQKAKEYSFIYHHRPVKPAQELVHWVEHVILTRGALHLRSPALNIPFYQLYYLDLAFLITIVLTVLTLVIKRLVLYILAKSRTGQSKKKKN